LNKDSFRILKEISSLYAENQILQQKIDQEKSRLTKIENLHEDKKENILDINSTLKELNIEIAQTENSIAEFQKKLDQAMSNKNNVFTENEIKAFETQIDSYQEKLDELENLGLEQLERQEQLNSELNDAEAFMHGSTETLKEIKLDVDEITYPLQEKINGHSLRIEQHFKEVPLDLKTKFSALMDKNLKYGPVAQIENNCCSVCGMEMPRLEIEKVEKHMQFKFCSTCGRLFIPISSLY